MSDSKHMPWWRKDKYGWPIELTIGQPINNFIRVLCLNLQKLGT